MLSNLYYPMDLNLQNFKNWNTKGDYESGHEFENNSF